MVLMEAKVLEKTDRSLKIKVLDADATVMYPLLEQLLQEERVVNANYSVEHQELDDPVLEVEVAEGEDPKELLIEISENFKNQFSEIHSRLFEEDEE